MSVTLGNSVTVARQTLTLFVGVQIPIPQPVKTSAIVGVFFYLFSLVFSQGFEGRAAQSNSPVDCCDRERPSRRSGANRIPSGGPNSASCEAMIRDNIE